MNDVKEKKCEMCGRVPAIRTHENPCILLCDTCQDDKDGIWGFIDKKWGLSYLLKAKN